MTSGIGNYEGIDPWYPEENKYLGWLETSNQIIEGINRRWDELSEQCDSLRSERDAAIAESMELRKALETLLEFHIAYVVGSYLTRGIETTPERVQQIESESHIIEARRVLDATSRRG